ncbi:DUF6225 family protein (plasmid) [Streptomyces sp. P8-A8]|uniref:DUF6225 family protein n=1 Tax=Streptomyces sp. P8-A8 TaxID=3029759 RepID=UPI0036D7CCD7
MKDLPDDTPIHIGVAEDPGDFGGYRESVLVDAHHVETWCRPLAPRPNGQRRRRRSPCSPTERPESTTCSTDPAAFSRSLSVAVPTLAPRSLRVRSRSRQPVSGYPSQTMSSTDKCRWWRLRK